MFSLSAITSHRSHRNRKIIGDTTGGFQYVYKSGECALDKREIFIKAKSGRLRKPHCSGTGTPESEDYSCDTLQATNQSAPLRFHENDNWTPVKCGADFSKCSLIHYSIKIWSRSHFLHSKEPRSRFLRKFFDNMHKYLLQLILTKSSTDFFFLNNE
jgi:hypothetical protein